MITLKHLNVVKIVESEEKAAYWESKGFRRVEPEPEKDEKPKTSKAKAEGGE